MNDAAVPRLILGHRDIHGLDRKMPNAHAAKVTEEIQDERHPNQTQPFLKPRFHNVFGPANDQPLRLEPEINLGELNPFPIVQRLRNRSG